MKKFKNIFGLFGAGGHGRETMDQVLSLINDKSLKGIDLKYFLSSLIKKKVLIMFLC